MIRKEGEQEVYVTKRWVLVNKKDFLVLSEIKKPRAWDGRTMKGDGVLSWLSFNSVSDAYKCLFQDSNDKNDHYEAVEVEISFKDPDLVAMMKEKEPEKPTMTVEGQSRSLEI